MKSIVWLLNGLLLLFMVACHEDVKKQPLEVISQLERTGVARFKAIEYGHRGDKEVYTYYFNDNSRYSWFYDEATKAFVFPQNASLVTFKKTVYEPQKYAQTLKQDITALNVKAITQAPWKGNLIRFWISSDAFISYTNPAFKYDSPAKQIWLDELNSGQLLKPGFYHIEIDE